MLNRYRMPSFGFTLIELLMAVAIMMIALGLVGGATVKSVIKAKAQAEVIYVYRLLKKSSIKSFSTGVPLELVFYENSLLVNVGGNATLKKDFEHLYFESKKIGFDRNGMPNSFSLLVETLGVKKALDFHSLFDSYRRGSGP